MPMNTVQTLSDLVTREIRPTFIDTYRIESEAYRDQMAMFMEMDQPSVRRQEFYAYAETSGYPERYQGDGVTSEAFKTRSFNAINYPWVKRIAWKIDDRKDSTVVDIVGQAKTTAQNWVVLPMLLAAQIKQATTDPTLLPVIPLAPDGVAIYNATDGDGNDRFGLSGGNTFTGAGVTIAGSLRTNLWTALARFRRFLNTKSKPLFNPGILGKGVLIEFAPANLQVFTEAFQQMRTWQVVQNAAATENVAAAGISNALRDGGFKFELFANPFLTGNSWYVTLLGAKKPLFEQVREKVYENFGVEENSDRARDNFEEYVQWKSRGTVAVGPAYGTISITNS